MYICTSTTIYFSEKLRLSDEYLFKIVERDGEIYLHLVPMVKTNGTFEVLGNLKFQADNILLNGEDISKYCYKSITITVQHLLKRKLYSLKNHYYVISWLYYFDDNLIVEMVWKTRRRAFA